MPRRERQIFLQLSISQDVLQAGWKDCISIYLSFRAGSSLWKSPRQRWHKQGGRKGRQLQKYWALVSWCHSVVGAAWHQLVSNPAECYPGQTPHCCICVTGKHLASGFPLCSARQVSREMGKETCQGFLQTFFWESLPSCANRKIFQRWVWFRGFFQPFHCDCKPGEVPALSICFSFRSLAHLCPWKIYA